MPLPLTSILLLLLGAVFGYMACHCMSRKTAAPKDHEDYINSTEIDDTVVVDGSDEQRLSPIPSGAGDRWTPIESLGLAGSA